MDRPVRAMNTYSCLMIDRRYRTPTLRFLNATDIEMAKAIAVQELQSSHYHLAVEVMDETGLIFRQTKSQ